MAADENTTFRSNSGFYILLVIAIVEWEWVLYVKQPIVTIQSKWYTLRMTYQLVASCPVHHLEQATRLLCYRGDRGVTSIVGKFPVVQYVFYLGANPA